MSSVIEMESHSIHSLPLQWKVPVGEEEVPHDVRFLMVSLGYNGFSLPQHHRDLVEDEICLGSCRPGSLHVFHCLTLFDAGIVRPTLLLWNFSTRFSGNSRRVSGNWRSEYSPAKLVSSQAPSRNPSSMDSREIHTDLKLLPVLVHVVVSSSLRCFK